MSKFVTSILAILGLATADYIFITHEHFDHLKQDGISQLAGDNTKLITNQSCADILGYGTVMSNGDVLQLADDITVEAVPAYNTSDGHQQFHPKGRDNDYGTNYSLKFANLAVLFSKICKITAC